MGVRASPRSPLCPRLVEIDADDGTIARTLDIEPRRWSGPEEPVECTVASWDGDLLLQPLLSELVWVDVDRWVVVRRLSHPLLHGVHGAVRRADGRIAVACAGPDAVVHLDDDGALCGLWPLAVAIDEADDLRARPYGALKPHAVHPNAVHEMGGRLWVTSLERRASLCEDGRVLPVAEGLPHDGVVRDELRWFTTTEGKVLAVDGAGARRVVLDLAEMTTSRRRLGWCRGLEVDGSRLWVGMSQLRSTTRREVARWMLQGERGRKLPTRVVEVDIEARRIVRETVLDDGEGGTVYGVLRCRTPGASARGVGVPESTGAVERALVVGPPASVSNHG